MAFDVTLIQLTICLDIVGNEKILIPHSCTYKFFFFLFEVFASLFLFLPIAKGGILKDSTRQQTDTVQGKQN